MNCFRFCGILCVAVVLGGCGKPPDRVEITRVQTRSETRPPARIDATSRERFWDALPASASMASAADPNAPFHWSAPATWVELPPTQFRLANFRFGANGEGECYISLLQGGGGGVLANVNRWRDQLGLSGLTADEFAALPTTTVLEQNAVSIDFEGAYSGMGNSPSKADYRMLGALLEYQGQGVYVKMVGPAEVVAREKLYFDAFVHSLHSPTGDEGGRAGSASADSLATGELPEGHPDIGATATAALAPPSESAGQGYRWEVPSGWSRGGDRPMRLATYTAGDGGAECVVSLLGGAAGGLVMNLNRWLGQFGQPARTEAEFLGGPQVSLLGQPVPLVFTAGVYSGMDGQSKQGQALLGVARISDAGSLFIKMIGPEKAVEAERANFVAFCESFNAK